MKHLIKIIVGSCTVFVFTFLLSRSLEAHHREYMPHGHCYYWEPHLVFTNIISNLLIALSYFTIPIIIIHYSKNRKDLGRYKPFFFLFSAFIFSCGVSHLFSIVDIFWASYTATAISLIITAILSIITAIALVAVMPLLIGDIDR